MSEITVMDKKEIVTTSDKTNRLALYKSNTKNALSLSVKRVADNALAIPALKEMITKSIDPSSNTNYVVDIPKVIQKKLNDGSLKLMSGKKGSYATLIDAKGNKIVQNLTVSPQQLVDMSGAMLNMGMHLQLQQIQEGIEELNKGIQDILKNFENDRHARALAEKEKFEQARLFINTELKNNLLINILSDVTITKHMLYKQLEFKVEKILEPSGLFEKDRSKDAQDVLENLSLFNEMFMIQLQCYTELNEYYALSHALEQYQLEMNDSFTREFQITLDGYFKESTNPFSGSIAKVMDKVDYASQFLVENRDEVELLEYWNVGGLEHEAM